MQHIDGHTCSSSFTSFLLRLFPAPASFLADNEDEDDDFDMGLVEDEEGGPPDGIGFGAEDMNAVLAAMLVEQCANDKSPK